VRELREFRAHHDAFVARGITVAGVTRQPPDQNLHWRDRLKLPYLLLSDQDGSAGRAFGVSRRVGLGAWSLEFFRRSTFLIDFHGRVAAVWGEVRIRGHAAEVIAVAETLARPGA